MNAHNAAVKFKSLNRLRLRDAVSDAAVGEIPDGDAVRSRTRWWGADAPAADPKDVDWQLTGEVTGTRAEGKRPCDVFRSAVNGGAPWPSCMLRQ